MITCIIAEKPSVARDIARIVGANTKQEGYLEGGGYLVTWAMGHLITLAMPEVYGFSTYKAEDLPIRPNPFRLIVRQVRKDKELCDDPAALKQLKAIRHCFGLAERIIVATDAGREGELIFRMIYQYLDCHKPFDRLWISSLTDKAIREGLAQVRAGRDYDNLYYSAKARSEADWLVGINASRALSIARKGGYSLGRVQTPTLAMVCRRYLENRNFSSVPYWRVNALVKKEGILLKAISTNSFDNEGSAQSALSALRSQSRLTVSSFTRKEGTTPPPLLYDLTSLQKEANRKCGFSADKTLSIAQSLYEKKVTTYPRTGSRYISEDVFEEVSVILGMLGEGLIAPLNRHSVDNGKVTDHHAIIPTGERALGLSADENIIYQMICTRFIEAFSPNSEEERMQVIFTDGSHSYIWKACHILSSGWKAVAQENKEKNKGEETENEEEQLASLPNLTEGETLQVSSTEITTHKTKPKPLYTEATLLSAMEHAGREVEETESRQAMAECGIGTPATRANIIETLILREYIRREKKSIVPTEKGLSVYEIVKDERIANAEMTGTWEVALSAIEAGSASAREFGQRIAAYTEQICQELLKLSPPQKSYPSYCCPKCGNKSVGIYAKIAKCRHEGCGFVIFREVCGTFLSEDNLRDLINTKRTPILKGLVSKAGKKFNARLVLQNDNTTTFEFEGKKKKK